MNKPKFIQELIQKYKDYKYTKPRYRIKNLYIGKIVILNERKFIGLGVWDSLYNPVKEFAVFYKKDDYTYVHIKSGLLLKKVTDIDAVIGNYAVTNIKPFKEIFTIGMRDLNQSENSKLSRSLIDTLETDANNHLAPNQNVPPIFGL